MTSDTRQPVALSECKATYDKESDILRVSDAVVRGNLIQDLLVPSVTAASSTGATRMSTTSTQN